jgi:hypothetical protein
LLTALLAPTATTEYERTDTHRYDAEEETDQLPTGKSYTEKGKDLKKDKAETYRWAIPSFGLRTNTAPEDYIGKRKPGTQEFMTEDDEVLKQHAKADRAFALMDEVAIAQLITGDSNFIGTTGNKGPFKEYDFHTEIVGSARGAKIDMTLGTAIEHDQAFRNQRRLVTQELERSMDDMHMLVSICGDNFFDKRLEIEKLETLARPLENQLDLASQPIPESSFGSGTFNHSWFDSRDGIRYINYGSQVVNGQKLIGDDDAYLIPVGASNLLRFAYAPANTRTYANTEAQRMYAWTYADEFKGVTTFYECNKLYACANPRLVRHLTTSN